ncbi:MAG: class I SAM-dependent methyltransferase [Candidatus Omnitrophica bacterium]|nr:class I SAM-dependent methyltransferase [Candidatus Omnitrophota bacterium]
MINKIPSSGKILNIGSKNCSYSPNVINLDIAKLPNVDIVADAHFLPFRESSFDGVIITAVLEIVKDPQAVIREIERILKPGGIVLATLPFLQPYHPDPTDYHRFTIEGVKLLFNNFEVKKLCNNRGPFSMFLWILREFLSIVFSFNCDTLSKIINIMLGWLFYPFHFLDHLWPGSRRLHIISASFLIIGSKKYR